MSKVSVSLKNADAFVFTLYHSLYCEAISACECTVLKQLRPGTEDGAVGQHYFKVVNPRSVYLNPGDEVVLAVAVLNISQVAEARRLGLIEVKVIESDESAEPATSEDS